MAFIIAATTIAVATYYSIMILSLSFFTFVEGLYYLSYSPELRKQLHPQGFWHFTKDLWSILID